LSLLSPYFIHLICQSFSSITTSLIIIINQKKIQNLFGFFLFLPHDKPLAIIAQRFPSLDYSRIEFAADARHRVCGCGPPLQMPCNEADAVKSARPKSKLCQHIIKRNALETD